MVTEKTFYPTSLSTMWAINNCQDLSTFFIVASKLGFRSIELNHQVNTTMLSGNNINHVKFSSVHEPCPADISTKQLVELDWLISSPVETSRNHGVEAVKKSIDLAHTLNAPVVVIHCGNVTSSMSMENQLRLLFFNGQTQSNAYIDTQSQIKKVRANSVGPRLLAVKKSLQELLEYADMLEIKLGLENRYHYMDIPSIDEMGDLLDLADESKLGFIYDVGHAQAMDLLGFYKHKDWLSRYSSRMFGTHLHDVSGLTDHLAPGLGEINFSKIAPYLPATAFRTLELLPINTTSQIEIGLDLLIKSGCITLN